MDNKYLLPCSCGRTHKISPRQAGETIDCECGTRLSMPGLREIRSLAVAPVAATKPAQVWGRRQGLIFLGLVALLAGAAAAGYFFLQIPPPLGSDIVQADLDSLDLRNAWLYWINLRDKGITNGNTAEIAIWRFYHERAHRNMDISLAVAGSGLLLAVGSALSGRAKRR